MPALQVRPGTAHDEDAALALWQVHEAQRGRRSGGARAQRVRARLRAPGALLLVAERDARVEGVLLAELVRDAAAPLEVGLLAGAPEPVEALLEALTARYPHVQAWTDEPGGYLAAGFAPSGQVLDGRQQVVRRPAADEA